MHSPWEILVQKETELPTKSWWLLDDRRWRRHGSTSHASKFTILLQATPIQKLVSHSRATFDEGSRRLKDPDEHVSFLQISVRASRLYGLRNLWSSDRKE